MKITNITTYQVDLPLHEGNYNWSGGKSVDVFDSTVVIVETDEGYTGVGEICPLGPAYLPSFARGARAGLAELSPLLIGMDPTALEVLNRHMDINLKGHPYVKSALDVACWDILGQKAGLPVAILLGGKYGSNFKLYRAISQESPEAMVKKVEKYKNEGYTKFQLKVGGDYQTDIERIHAVAKIMEKGDTLVADANTGWLMHDAAKVVAAVRELNVYIEQPCLSYEECLNIRQRTSLPFILDENIDGMQSIGRGPHSAGVGHLEWWLAALTVTASATLREPTQKERLWQNDFQRRSNMRRTCVCTNKQTTLLTNTFSVFTSNCRTNPNFIHPFFFEVIHPRLIN